MLGPDISHLRVRLSPGFCDISHGAVEHIDWRDYQAVGRDSAEAVALRAARTAEVFLVRLHLAWCCVPLP